MTRGDERRRELERAAKQGDAQAERAADAAVVRGAVLAQARSKHGETLVVVPDDRGGGLVVVRRQAGGPLSGHMADPRVPGDVAKVLRAFGADDADAARCEAEVRR